MSRISRQETREKKVEKLSFNNAIKLTAIALICSFAIAIVSVKVAVANDLWHFCRIDAHTKAMDCGTFYIVERKGQKYILRKDFPNDLYLLERSYKRPDWIGSVIK